MGTSSVGPEAAGITEKLGNWKVVTVQALSLPSGLGNGEAATARSMPLEECWGRTEVLCLQNSLRSKTRKIQGWGQIIRLN